MNINALITAATKAAQLAGANEPAFREIMNQIKVLVGPADQAKLDAALASAEQQSNIAHSGLQSAARGE
jgi:hypothetical protein